MNYFDSVLLIPWFMFGTFVAIVLDNSSPKWFRRLPSDDARFAVCVGVVLLFPLILGVGAAAFVAYLLRSFGRGLLDVTRHVFAKPVDPLPRAQAREP